MQPLIACNTCGQLYETLQSYESTVVAPGRTVLVAQIDHYCPRTTEMFTPSRPAPRPPEH